MSAPLEVSGKGIESEEERTEVKNYFRSKARIVLESLISQISKNLDDLVWEKRRQYIGHILATLVFLSLSCHVNQLNRLKLPGVAANESSTRADVDDMNRNVQYINQLIYSTFRQQIKKILEKPNEDSPQSEDSNRHQINTLTGRLWHHNSTLICGLWAIMANISGYAFFL